MNYEKMQDFFGGEHLVSDSTIAKNAALSQDVQWKERNLCNLTLTNLILIGVCVTINSGKSGSFVRIVNFS